MFQVFVVIVLFHCFSLTYFPSSSAIIYSYKNLRFLSLRHTLFITCNSNFMIQLYPREWNR